MSRPFALLAATVAVAFTLAGCAGDTAPPAPTSPPAPAAGPEPAPSAVSPGQAGKIVTDKYGGQVLGVEPDTARGQPSWEVEVAESTHGRIEVDIAQRTGEIAEFEQD